MGPRGKERQQTRLGYESVTDRAEMVRVVLDETVDSVVRFDRDLRYDYVNERSIQLTGVPFHENIGKNTDAKAAIGAAAALEADGLCAVSGRDIRIPPSAHRLMRAVAACFDAHLPGATTRHARAV